MEYQKVKKCIACNSNKLHSLNYAEGVIHICSECGLQWGKRHPSLKSVPTENQHYHSPNTIFSKGPAYEPYEDFFSEIRKRFGSRQLRILDVGCGSGAFIQAALTRGHDVVGIEIDTSLKQYMTKEVLERVTFCSAEGILSATEGEFDIVTFWDSFEHMEFAFNLLDDLAPLLTPQGILYIRVNNTHDAYNYTALLALRMWPKMGKRIIKTCFNFPDHVWNFSHDGMQALLAQKGASISSVQFGETPSWRLTGNTGFKLAIEAIYMVNKLMKGGKIGNYYLTLNK